MTECGKIKRDGEHISRGQPRTPTSQGAGLQSIDPQILGPIPTPKWLDLRTATGANLAYGVRGYQNSINLLTYLATKFGVVTQSGE